jgi:3-oxoadipate enol-lactonase
VRLGHTLDGPHDAPLLVLSPALGTTTSIWESQLPALSAGRRVLRHDLPGHGASELPAGPVTVERIGRAQLGLLDDLGAARFSFCGISLGGMVGQWLGANAPERLDGLVLACTGAKLGDRADYHARAELVRREGPGVVAPGARERGFTPAFRDAPEAQRILDELASTPRAGYAACAEAVGDWDFRGELDRIAVPPLLVFGEHDPMTTPAVRETLAGIAGARVVTIPDASHLANVERPEAFVAAVEGAL